MSTSRQLEIRRLVDQARLALQAQVLDVAQRRVAAALRLDPGHLQARLLQAQLDLAANRPRRALEHLDAHDQHAAEPDGDHIETRWLRAMALVRCRKDEQAIDLLEAIRRHQPDDPRIPRVLAALYLRQGKRRQAAGELQAVLGLTPGDSDTSRTLAAMVSSSQPQTAIDLLPDREPQMPGDNPDSPPTSITEDRATLWLERARLYRRCGRLRDAEETWCKLLSARPDEPALWLEAAELAAEVGATALAAERIGWALRFADVNRFGAWSLWATVQMHGGRFESAGACWWRAARCAATGAEQTDAWAGLLVCGLLCRRSELVRRAKARLSGLTGDRQRRSALGRQWSAAASGRILRERRRDPQAHVSPQASPLQSLLSGAVQTLTQHSQQHPHRADTFYHLAICSQALGDRPAASEAVNRALAINPRYESARRLANRMGGRQVSVEAA